MLGQIEKEIEKLEMIQSTINSILEKAPEGKLRCAINRGHYQYYSGNEYLGEKKKPYIKQIAQKEYCIRLSARIERYLKKWNGLRSLYQNEALEDVYRNLHPARKQIVKPLVKPIELLVEEFEKMEYAGKDFYDQDETAYYTAKGERVRSKSEKIIADELLRYNVPYKYEMPISLREKNRVRQLFPDFTALNRRTGKKWLIEHLGMMDDPAYFDTTMRKLDLYEKNGILIGSQLLLLHETSDLPLNVNVLRKYIETYLL